MYAKIILLHLLCALSTNYAMEQIPPLHNTIIDSNLSLEEKLTRINTLVKNGEDVNKAITCHGLTPLHFCVMQPNQKEIIMALRKEGANPYLTTAYGQCTIIGAMDAGQTDNIKALLQDIPHSPKVIPTNINWQDKKGQTFLHWIFQFAEKNSKETTTNIVKLLLSYNANPNITQHSNQLTPLHYAAGMPNCDDSILELGKAGANVCAQSKESMLPFNVSSLNNRRENTKAILDLYIALFPSVKQ